MEAIWHHDKLIIILSEQSISSDGTVAEIRKALQRERGEGVRMLFPIRVVDHGG